MTDNGDWLKADRVGRLKRALESFGRTEKQLEEDVSILTEWLKTQMHLPEIPSKNHIINTLLLNKFSIERCKQRLDMYYTIRTLLPEVYDNLDSKAMLKEADIVNFFPLPKSTTEDDNIILIRLNDKMLNKYNVNSSLGYCYNTMDVWFNEGVLTNFIVICDLKEVNMAVFQKITVVHLKKMIMVLEKVYSNRVKQFHLLNCPYFANTMLNLLRSLLKPKISSRLFFHEDISKIATIVPLEILPEDYGGSELSVYELNEIWKKKLVEYGERFDVLSKMKTNEKLRPSPLVNDEILGFHGNFKKLQVD